MKKYSEMTREELIFEKELLKKRYEEKKALGLKLDISRGKPCQEQLALSLPMLDLINSETENFKNENGFAVSDTEKDILKIAKYQDLVLNIFVVF